MVSSFLPLLFCASRANNECPIIRLDSPRSPTSARALTRECHTCKDAMLMDRGFNNNKWLHYSTFPGRKELISLTNCVLFARSNLSKMCNRDLWQVPESSCLALITMEDIVTALKIALYDGNLGCFHGAYPRSVCFKNRANSAVKLHSLSKCATS